MEITISETFVSRKRIREVLAFLIYLPMTGSLRVRATNLSAPARRFGFKNFGIRFRFFLFVSGGRSGAAIHVSPVQSVEPPAIDGAALQCVTFSLW